MSTMISEELLSDPLGVTENFVVLPKKEHHAYKTVRQSDVVALKELLDQGFDINTQHEDVPGDDIYTIKWQLRQQLRLRQYSLLHVAVVHGNIEIIEFLLASGADVNLPDVNFFSPVSVAVALQRADVVQLLIQAGADVNVQSISGQSPLSRAVRTENLTIVEMLLDAGADPDVADSKGSTPLLTCLITASPDRIDILQALIKAGCNLEHTSKQGATAIMTAVGIGKHLHVRILIEAGANINKTDNSGKSVFQFAIGVRMALMLINNGAAVDIEDNNGHRALDWAAHVGHIGMLRLLLGVDCKRPSASILEVPRVEQVRQQLPAFDAWITQELGQPRELKRICRGGIRDMLGPAKLIKINELPLPNLIKNYLLAKGIDLSFGGYSMEKWQRLTGVIEGPRNLPVKSMIATAL